MKKNNTAQKLAGDNSEKGRTKMDFYPTPPYVTEALLKRETFTGDVWECACGTGDMSKVLENNGYKVYSSDIGNYGYGVDGFDFLDDKGFWKKGFVMYRNIITNPPFNLSLEFVLQAKIYAKDKIAMFLRTSFLEGVGRYEMFQDKEFPLKTVYQFSRRVGFGKHAGTHKGGGMIPFAWFVWERGYKGKPTIEWII